jgi:hypothetical protein
MALRWAEPHGETDGNGSYQGEASDKPFGRAPMSEVFQR